MSRKTPIRAIALAFILLASGLVFLPAPAAAEQWAKIDMGKPYGGQATNGLFGVAVGDGDRNGQNEVYFSCDDNGRVYRYNYTNGTWNITDVGIIVGGNPYEAHARAILVGDGDDDAKTEVYVNGLSRQNWWNTSGSAGGSRTDRIRSRGGAVGFGSDHHWTWRLESKGTPNSSSARRYPS